MISYGNHRFPGKLFVVEGTDGSGKSTQLALLYQWLKAEGYPVFFSEWNSSPLVKNTTKRAKKRHLFTPATFSLLHATDFADRTERDIIPPLKAGAIVLADRYSYTAFARDVARGCEHEWVREVYRFAVKPNVAFFFRAPLDVAIDRIISGRPDLKYYQAGLDMGWYLIENSELTGFSEAERAVIANIARYQCGPLPKERHPDYAALNTADRETVCRLGAIVRVADALDRRHESRVSDLRCYREGDDVRIQIKSAVDCANELREAERKREMFEQAFQCTLTFSICHTKVKRASSRDGEA